MFIAFVECRGVTWSSNRQNMKYEVEMLHDFNLMAIKRCSFMLQQVSRLDYWNLIHRIIVSADHQTIIWLSDSDPTAVQALCFHKRCGMKFKRVRIYDQLFPSPMKPLLEHADNGIIFNLKLWKSDIAIKSSYNKTAAVPKIRKFNITFKHISFNLKFVL